MTRSRRRQSNTSVADQPIASSSKLSIKPPPQAGRSAAAPPPASYLDDEDDEDEDDAMVDDDASEVEAPLAAYEPDPLDGHEDDMLDDDEEEDDSEEDEFELERLQKTAASLPLRTLKRAQSHLQASGSSSSTGDSTTRLASVKARLAAIQRQKGKAAGVDVDALEREAQEEPSSDQGEEEDGRPMGLRGVWRARKIDREQERQEERSREEEREKRKRDNKNAPMALSSKRPVSRFRQVVELPKHDRRDPRFDSTSAATVDAGVTARSYSFVPDLMREELSTLQQALVLATKRERSSPRDEREERANERERLEREVARARSRLERHEREARERDVLQKVKREERAARNDQGKEGFYVKRSERKDRLLQARFEALEAKGGKRAVRKAIEKKQKKVAGKEKKSRPFAVGGGGAGGGAGAGGPAPKRRRV